MKGTNTMKRFSHLLKSTILFLSLLTGVLWAQDTITVVAVGDVMLGTIFPKRSDLADEETATHFFDEVKPYFKGDVVFCNMEGVLADSLVKECKMFCFGKHVTRKADYYIEQNRGNAYEFAHLAIDAGADLVLGHGPHVTRGEEIYNNKFIAYSVGNFATYSQIKIGGLLGVAPIFIIRMDAKTGDFIDAQVVSTHQFNPNTGPHVDPDNQALKLIKSLSATDFYDNPPTISDDGWITK